MKKMSLVAIMLIGGIAFASSLSIPWYVDNAPTNNGLPPTKNGAFSLIFLKSTVDRPLTCTIEYYNENGDYLGPNPQYVDYVTGKNYANTFVIQPRAALGFRPVADDPIGGETSPWGLNGVGAVGSGGGQEGHAGMLVPNRPRAANATTNIPGTTVPDMKKNGSITIRWEGPEAEATDLQGSQMAWSMGGAGSATVTVVSFSHLLPPGK